MAGTMVVVVLMVFIIKDAVLPDARDAIRLATLGVGPMGW